VINLAIVIINDEKLTGLRFFSKCGLGYRTSDTQRAIVTKHCEECGGKFHKKLKLNSSLAFVPHIIKIRLYSICYLIKLISRTINLFHLILLMILKQ
jgi:hypothetical protein